MNPFIIDDSFNLLEPETMIQISDPARRNHSLFGTNC
jgi:hypothetical protein